MAEYIRFVDEGKSEKDATGNWARVMVSRPYTDAEIMAELPARVRLVVDRTTISADGVDEAVVTVELVSAPLNDDRQKAIKRSEQVVFFIDGEATIITLNGNGRETLEISAVEAGEILIEPYSHTGNSITIEVV